MQTAELAEIARLLNQAGMVSSSVPMLPIGIEGSSLNHVLDIGCGPGGWLLDLVTKHPHITGVGIDLSPQMIRMATHLKQAELKEQLTFLHMDATHALAFPSATFDFIQMRLSHSFLLPSMWPGVLAECYRALRPGGTLAIIDLEAIFTNKRSTEEYFQLMPITWSKVHMSYSPTGHSMGILAALIPLLREAGFSNRHTQLHSLDVSKGEPDHALAIENTQTIFANLLEMYTAKGGYTQEYLLDLAQKAEAEMQAEDYACISLLFSTWATKKE